MRYRPTHAPLAILLTVFCSLSAYRVITAGEPIRQELNSARQPMIDLEEGWANPPRIARTRCWWWWLNGNVTRSAITRDLEQMKAKGYGGANVIDAGGAEQGGHCPVPHGPDFATPEWRKLFTHALAEADRLGLELGFNILSGWNLGGPGVLPDQAAKKLTWSETAVEGGQQRAIELPAPECRDGYYRDVAVVAIPTRARRRSAKVTIAASSRQASHPASCTLDSKPDTYWVSDGIQPGQGPRPDHPEWLELRFAEPVKADRVQLVPRNNYGPRRGTIEAITRGETRHVADFAMQSTKPLTLSFAPQTADRFRWPRHSRQSGHNGNVIHACSNRPSTGPRVRDTI